jgi:hypothetical protein
MTMLQKIQVVPAAKTYRPREVSPELEERLRQLEREIGSGRRICGRADAAPLAERQLASDSYTCLQ